MFKYELNSAKDDYREVEISFRFRQIPRMDDNICGIGAYSDWKTNLSFYFDTIYFQAPISDDGQDKHQVAIFYYAFTDLIYTSYKSAFEQRGFGQINPKSEEDLIVEFQEAFTPYLTRGGHLKWVKIGRLVLLTSPGIVKSPVIIDDNSFNYLDTSQIKERFEQDIRTALGEVE